MPATAQKPSRPVRSEPGAIERTTELSERVLGQVKESQESAIEAVRKFMTSVDEALPPRGDRQSRRQDVIDSALEMSERLVGTQYDFLTNVVHGAGEALGGPGKSKK